MFYYAFGVNPTKIISGGNLLNFLEGEKENKNWGDAGFPPQKVGWVLTF